jgi:alcohol dehydrogenase class IV
MTMRFEFATATKIIFGAGTLREAGAAAKEFGQRALVVTGRDAKRAARPAWARQHFPPQASRSFPRLSKA